MFAGKLDQRVLLERPDSIQSASGDPVVTWLPQFTVWAAVEPIRGREFTSGSQILGVLDTKVRLRYSSQTSLIDPTWRIRHRGVILNIVSVAEVNTRHEEIELLCKSGSNEG